MNLHNINTIANYESKLLRRGWLFRIFALLAIVVFIIFDLAQYSRVFWQYSDVWNYIGLSSIISYSSNYSYNIFQAVILIFLAGGFIKRDKKLDTAEVIYVRPMSNSDYVFGKIWGVVRVFLVLNFVILFIGMFVNVVVVASPFNPLYYLFYLFTISLPTLLMVLGLSFALMSVLRNQAITFILMLGFTGILLFYVKADVYCLFDLYGNELPAIFSDVTGHVNLDLYLRQRALYVFFGLGFIFLTIALMNRLPLRPWKTKVLVAVACMLFFIGTFESWLYVKHFEDIIEVRNYYREVYNQYADVPKAKVETNELVVERDGGALNVESRLTLLNDSLRDIDRIILYLNPTLDVKSITVDGEAVNFKREGQVVIAKREIAKNTSAVLTIRYRGVPDENVCYADIDDDVYLKKPEFSDFFYGKRYIYVGDVLTLLTPEALWYPVTETPVNPSKPYVLRKNFTHYNLKYVNTGGKTVISQGDKKVFGDTVNFTNSQPLTGISLAVGDYETRSVTVDSVDYEINFFKGHDFFSKHFNLLQDTLPALIREVRNSTEISKNRDYLFSKFVMVETPIHFTTYVRNWKGYTEFVQPELVFMPERGVGTSSDFTAMTKRTKDWRRRDASLDDSEVQVQVFKDYIKLTFLDEAGTQVLASASADVNQRNVGAMFFDHTGFLYSEKYPVADIVINAMQNVSATDEQTMAWLFGGSAISDKLRANMYLSDHSFSAALSDKNIKAPVLYELVKMKSLYLKYYVLAQISNESFKKFLKETSKHYIFSEYPFSAFVKDFEKEYGINLSEFLEGWYNVDHTPIVEIEDVETYKVVKDDFTKYQLRFKVINRSPQDAVISVKVQSAGGGFGNSMSITVTSSGGIVVGNGGGTSAEPDYYIIPANSANEIKIINDDRPNSLSVNTNISGNIPMEYSYNFSRVDRETSDTAVGMFPVSMRFLNKNQGEIIVDNEDAGFKTISGNKKRALKEFFHEEDEDKYKTYSNWNQPYTWTATIGDKCYGLPVHSAVYKRKGDGRNKVEWQAELPEDNYYEISIWNVKFDMGFNIGRRNRQGDANNHTYTITNNDNDVETVAIDINQEENGWVSLGSFYLEKGDVIISLGDNVSGGYVVADAVKITPPRKMQQHDNRPQRPERSRNN
ncbi:MAG: hypothetical protein LBM07_01495 [Culturomica sp.]|jgi:ABC-type transport system involved in multi-copper enzyme maturation permease subunit|nr:hypothetical protein [Culturomica sp.]